MSLVQPITRGDPESPLRWISKSLRHLVQALRRLGHLVSTFVVRRILHQEGFSLQANRKTHEGGNHPDRDLQFKYISNKMKEFLDGQEPVISIDAKKKELIGNFKNSGRE